MTSVSVYLVMLVIPLFEAARFRCDYSYIPCEGWFKLHYKPRDLNTAKRICLREGAELVTNLWPKTEKFKTATLSMFNNTDVTAIHIDSVSVGKTIIDIKIPTITEENIVLVLTKNGTVEGRPALEKINFICHKMAGAAEELNECGTADSEYSYDIKTRHCYKFHRIRNTWSGAKEICTNEGGNLVVINNDIEAQVIKNLFNSNNIDQYLAFVGLYNKGRNSYWESVGWQTVDGYPLSMYGYNIWVYGTPTDVEGCGTVERDGMLSRHLCNEEFQFICEKKIYDCNEKYTLDIRTGNCYKFQRNRMPYHHSNMACNKEGGKLVVINSETEAQVIRDLFNRNPTHSISGNVRDLAYIGVHEDWKNVDGDSISKSEYNKWAPGEPKQDIDANCTTVKRNGLLFADQCMLDLPSICEKKMKDCDDYTFDNRTGNCYKFHGIPQLWSHAFEICTHEGGNLVVINSETEAQVIRDLYKRNPLNSINQFRDAAYVGLLKFESTFEWTTIDGLYGNQLTLAQLDVYFKWAKHQPDNENRYERCLTVDRDGLLSDEVCFVELPFICEKKNEYCM